MASYISSPQFSPCAFNWIYCPDFFSFSFFPFFLSPSFTWLIGLIPAVQIEVCQSYENDRSQTQQSEEGDKITLPKCISGFQWCTQRKFSDTLGALKTTLVHKFSIAIIPTSSSHSHSLVRWQYFFADHCFLCVARYLSAEDQLVRSASAINI